MLTNVVTSLGSAFTLGVEMLGPALCTRLATARSFSSSRASPPPPGPAPSSAPGAPASARAFKTSSICSQLHSDAVRVGQDQAAGAPAEIPEIYGQIHSLDSFTSVDGPGLRYLVFLQGCVFRCKFCSNPDSWALKGGSQMSSKDIAHRLQRVSPYLMANKGGITTSGGEPLLQPYFLAAIYQEAHALKLTTCLDTTGQGTHSHWDVVLPHTDHVLLCPKAPDARMYEELTGQKQKGMIRFADELASRGIPTWLRYVYIPEMTDRPSDLEWLVKFVHERPNIEMIDLLPLHRLGENKWREMGMKYPLAGHPMPKREDVASFADRLRENGVKVAW